MIKVAPYLFFAQPMNQLGATAICWMEEAGEVSPKQISGRDFLKISKCRQNLLIKFSEI